MTTLRLYRGIAVPAASVDAVTSSLRRDGLVERRGKEWVHLWSVPSGVSIEKAALCLEDTRDANWRSAVFACGTLEGAAYYAWEHNRSETNNTPILIEFESYLDQVRIDGRDFLYLSFQGGDPEEARTVLESIYGSKILRYAELAWASRDHGRRVALCDLATLDPDVVLAHYASRTIIRGRYGTTFENAFTVAYPVLPSDIVRVWTPSQRGAQISPSVTVQDIVPATPSQEPESRQDKEEVPAVSVLDIWRFKYKN